MSYSTIHDQELENMCTIFMVQLEQTRDKGENEHHIIKTNPCQEEGGNQKRMVVQKCHSKQKRNKNGNTTFSLSYGDVASYIDILGHDDHSFGINGR